MSTDTPTKLTPAEVVEAVDEWLAAHAGADKREAFAAIAERAGRTPNGLAQTYYGAKRRAGSTTRKRRQVSTTAALSPKATAAMRSLTEHIAALEAEVAELRAFKTAVVGAIGRG